MTTGSGSERTLGRDFCASVVVFLVALPLCMGIAIASGAPPAAGLVTGIIGGILVGFIGGAPLQVSGPAAGLAVLVWQIVQEHGLAGMGIIVLAGGAMQLAAGLLRLGQWFRAISPAVIYGMLGGIGVLILGSQFHIMLDDEPRGSGLANLISIPESIYKGLFPLDGSAHHLAAMVGIVTIGTMLLWMKFRPNGLKLVPAPLVGVVTGTAVAGILGLPIKYVVVPQNLFDTFTFPTAASFALLARGDFLFEAAALAFIASAETLLSTAAVDQMHRGPRANYDRELAAQGVGNMLCGFLGALPMTGVIVRSSANVEAGAVTRRSAIFHGVWILALVIGAPSLLSYVPTAALAAILVYTGYKLLKHDKVHLLARFGRSEVFIYAATLVGIVATDLLKGVMIGFGLALIKLLYTFTHLSVKTRTSPDGRRADMVLEGAATFIGLPKLAASLEKAPCNCELHVHIENLYYVDHACLDLLQSWRAQHESGGTKVILEWHKLEPQSEPSLRLGADAGREELQEGESQAQALAESAGKGP